MEGIEKVIAPGFSLNELLKQQRPDMLETIRALRESKRAVIDYQGKLILMIDGIMNGDPYGQAGAEMLAELTDTSPEFWMEKERRYRAFLSSPYYDSDGSRKEPK